jgi:hypothetical protein
MAVVTAGMRAPEGTGGGGWAPGDSGAGATFKNRTTRLITFGILSLLCGGACLLFSLLTLAIPLLPPSLTGGASGGAVSFGAALPAACVYGLIAAAFVALGVGSIRARRWVRPLMLTLAWTWLLAGCVSVVVLLALGSGVLLLSGGSDADVPQGAIPVIFAVTIGFVGCIEVLLPLAFLWAYRSKDVQLTCERANPAPSWTDRCPPPVLGLSVALAAGALLSLPLIFHPAFPVFGRMVTGAPAVLMLLASAALFALLALGCYRQRRWAWWGLLAATALMGVSSLVSCLTIDPQEIARAMELGEDQAEMLREAGIPGNPVLAVAVVLFTLLCAGYLLTVRRHFFGERGADDTGATVR